ncbi:MAG: hypothetical protein ACR2PZ_15565, partial [Pseudomonadales bacterium]
AESAYYRSLVDYNRAIMRIHFRKGSLLEYNGVYLAEGPWPGKAKFDALRRARQRDASTYLDYGFTRPGVISQGPHAQFQYPSNGSTGIEPTPASDGPVMQEAEPLEDPANENGQPEQEVIPPPTGIQVTTATALLEPTTASNVAPAIATAPVAPTDMLIGLPAVMPAQLSAQRSAQLPDPLPVVPRNTQHTTPSAADTSGTPQLHINPYRREMKTWMDSTTGGLPTGAATVNPLRPQQGGQFTSSWSADVPSAHAAQAEQPSAKSEPETTAWPATGR